MKILEVSGAVRLLQWSLGVKGLIVCPPQHPYCLSLRFKTVFYAVLTDSHVTPIVA